MGLDLAVAPMRHTPGGWWLCHQRLDFDRDYRLFGCFQGAGRSDCEGPKLIVGHPLPPGAEVNWYEDEGIKRRTTDPYGTPLTYCPAGDFAKIPLDSQTPWNRGVLAFLQAIPPDTPVVLWWH